MLPKNIDFQEIEEKWYKIWEEKKYFRSVPNEKEPYTIVIPPPNVTGVLHMGHMLNNTIQDILIRKARMQGYNACWVPGVDHASIATEAKVVAMLKEKGISKYDIGREEFLKHAFDWKEKYGGIILSQLKKLGASCDWERTRFTMEEKLSKAVIQSFIQLYKKGYLYRGYRMTNWDPEAKTALSNEEVNYKEVNSRLFYVKYAISGKKDEYITIATTRPETIMGDTAICVHPDDSRYSHLKGAKAIVPIVNREVPIIFDDYIDIEFGTGALKVTPAHDENDYQLGMKHKLETIDVFNPDGTMSSAAQVYIGEDRFVVRKKIAKDLEEMGILDKVEDIRNKVGYSERTDAVVEPRLTYQWFLKMEELVKPALENVLNDNIRFFPPKFKNLYKNWLDNIKDWCISRQLWWGQQIPAWYDEEGNCVIAENAGEAEAEYEKQFGKKANLKQDEDVVDTWFSSWLWPISVFDGFEDEKELNYYYPTTTLVTGWDIIFFWVARMIIAGYEFKGEMPFKNVYFTGMVRDKQRRKMSKSLGNSPDVLELIKTYGADGVRAGVMLSSAAGNDLLFDEKLCEQGRNFSNKIWNALRLIEGWEADETIPYESEDVVKWFDAKLSDTIIQLEKSFEDFRLSEALMTLYNFIWDDFCSWYLEMIKPESGKINPVLYQQTVSFFKELMKLLHPFMPFVSEEIFSYLKKEIEPEITISTFPVAKSFDLKTIEKGEHFKAVITAIRDWRAAKGVKNKEQIKLYYRAENPEFYQGYESLLVKMANLSSLETTNAEISDAFSILVNKDTLYIVANLSIDAEAEKKKIEEEIKYLEGFMKSINIKLSNENFVSNAPAQVVDRERQKYSDAQQKIESLTNSLKNL